jgi:hypothetical protein
MTAATISKDALLTGLRGVLKSQGFRKRDSVFHRPSADVVHLIALQSSIDSAGQIPRVTVNLAIWCKRLAAAGTEPAVLAAQWRCRIGDVMPPQSEAWWLLSGKPTVAPAISGMSAALKAHGIPALDRLPDLAALLALWDSGQSPGLTPAEARRYAQLAREAGG